MSCGCHDPLRPSRGILRGLLIGLLAWVAMIAGATQAVSLTDAEIGRQLPQIQRMDQDLGAFMDVHGYSVGDYSITTAPPEWFGLNVEFTPGYPSEGHEIVAAAQPGAVVFSHRILPWVADRDMWFDLLLLIAHERSHQMQVGSLRTDTDRFIEEGVVEAVATDAVRAYVRARYPGWYDGWDTQGAYDRGVQMVRSASARRTGRSWRSSKAREWRRYLWRQSPEDRILALRRAGVGV